MGSKTFFLQEAYAETIKNRMGCNKLWVHVGQSKKKKTVKLKK